MLGSHWEALLVNAINTLYGYDINVPFAFQHLTEGGDRAVSYGLTRVLKPSMNDEMKKGGEIFLLGGIAQVFGHNRNPKIAGVDPRLFGKLTQWCNAHLGLTTYQSERDRTRRPRAGRPDPSPIPLPPQIDSSDTEPEP